MSGSSVLARPLANRGGMADLTINQPTKREPGMSGSSVLAAFPFGVASNSGLGVNASHDFYETGRG